MSQPDLVARLHEARPTAPPELRERVRLIAAGAAVPPRRRLTWRRAAVVLVPVAAAIAAAVTLLPHGGKQAVHPPSFERAASTGAAGGDHALSPAPTVGAAGAKAPTVPAPSSTRAQRYSASLELRLRSARAVSDATKRAGQIVASLGGYPASLNVDAGGATGYADLRFRVPRARTEEAVSRLAALGTIVNENVSIQDLQTKVNATADLIARLQRQLAGWRAVQPPTTRSLKNVDALTTRIQRLQRGQASTLRVARYATVELQLTTRTPVPRVVHHHHGPLHGLGIAFHWLWIGAVYALALGALPAALVAALGLLVRALRRRRENALLSRS